MRISQAHLDVLAIPFREPLVSGAARSDRCHTALLTLQGDDGSIGIAEGPAPERFDAELGARLSRLLKGVDVADGDALESALRSVDARPGGPAVRAAIASAMADLLARAEGRSVAASLAPKPRGRVAVNALIGAVPPAQAASEARRYVAAGFRCLKVKGGGEPSDALVDRVAAVRAAAGPETVLRVDLNGTLEGDSALAVLERLAAYDLEYVEQPVAPQAGVPALAKLRRASAVAVALDESVRGLATARALLDGDAADVLVVKPASVGGLRQARGIIDLAEAAGVAVTVSTLFEAGIGVAGALHLAATVRHDRVHGLTTSQLLVSDLLIEPLAIVDGWMAVPSGPGLGIELDPRAVARFRVA